VLGLAISLKNKAMISKDRNVGTGAIHPYASFFENLWDDYEKYISLGSPALPSETVTRIAKRLEVPASALTGC
jgi:hypothetical protein